MAFLALSMNLRLNKVFFIDSGALTCPEQESA